MPVILLWDASALSKRYALEIGSKTVDALFSFTTPIQMISTFLGYAETHAVLLRKRNRGEISPSTYTTIISNMQNEVLKGVSFDLLTVEDTDMLDGIEFIERHNLNASDSALLSVFLRFAATESSPSVLVASDQRFIRAANAEGLKTLNPETLSETDVQKFIDGL